MARRLCLLLLAALLGACTYESSGTTTTTRPEVVALPPATTPASITLSDQRIEGSSLVVDSVSLPAPGFIVVREDDGGSPGAVMGVSELLPAGIAESVPVPFFVPIAQAMTVHATIQIDMDSDGVFSYEPPDFIDTIATVSSGEPAGATAALTLLAPLGPAGVSFEDQTSDGTSVTVASVTLPAPGFVAIQTDADGAAGDILAVSDLLPAGVTADLAFALDPRIELDADLHAVAYVDRDEDGVFDPIQGADAVGVRADGGLADQVAAITVILRGPTAIDVSDQESPGDTVVIDSLELPAPGFVEILSDQAGAPGSRLGVSPLRQAGDLSDIEVTLDTALTRNATVWVRVWVDFDGSGVLSDGDLRALDDGGDPIEVSFAVTIK
jgi:hypothetical protein